MAKIYRGFLSILILCYSCNSGVPAPGVTSQKDSVTFIAKDSSFPAASTVTTDSAYVKDAVNDIPVRIDTANITMPSVKQIEKATPAVKKNKSVQEIYISYIGVRELTGNNDGKEVERFLKNVGLGKGFPWCAAFVKTCLIEGGVPSATHINGMASSCLNKDNLVYFGNKKIQQPVSGDVFCLWFNNLHRIGHTGFFDKQVNSTVFESVEGNTNSAGSREGDGVYRKKRSYRATYSISRWK